MLQVARLAPKLLGDSAELVADFLRSQRNDGGGFAGRDGKSDLYYTVFGLEGLLALRADLPANETAAYLRSFGDGAELDFVHLTCLARCWAALPTPLRDEAAGAALLGRLEAYRSADGGYDAEPAAESAPRPSRGLTRGRDDALVGGFGRSKRGTQSSRKREEA